jgi:hypothetical protein
MEVENTPVIHQIKASREVDKYEKRISYVLKSAKCKCRNNGNGHEEGVKIAFKKGAAELPDHRTSSRFGIV